MSEALLLVSSVAQAAEINPQPEDVRAEFIFVEAPFAQCHASTVVETSDGQLLAAWFAGTIDWRSDVLMPSFIHEHQKKQVSAMLAFERIHRSVHLLEHVF